MSGRIPTISTPARGRTSGRAAHRSAGARPSAAGTFHVERGTFGCLVGSLPLLARHDVGGVPPGPVMLRSGRFVLAMALLCLSQKLGESRDVHTESSSGKPRLDLLEQPAVAVWITE